MRKYTNPAPIPNGGMPIYAAEFIGCLQTEVYRAIIAPYLQYGEPIIINGCIVTPNIGAGTCTITAGMAFIDGDLIDVPAYAGAFPVYLHQGAATTVTKAYKDTQPRAVTIEKTCAYVPALPGAGESILFNPYTSQYLRDVKRRYETPVNELIPFVDYPDGDSAPFDPATGIGKWQWLGFQIATEMTGRVLVQFDPADPDFAIGNPFGEKNHTLTSNEMPIHGHTISTSDSPQSGSDGSDPVRSSSGGGVNSRGGAGAGKTIGTAGGGQTHNNTQKSFSGVYLKRI
jgi:hypothetical protein